MLKYNYRIIKTYDNPYNASRHPHGRFATKRDGHTITGSVHQFHYEKEDAEKALRSMALENYIYVDDEYIDEEVKYFRQEIENMDIDEDEDLEENKTYTREDWLKDHTGYEGAGFYTQDIRPVFLDGWDYLTDDGVTYRIEENFITEECIDEIMDVARASDATLEDLCDKLNEFLDFCNIEDILEPLAAKFIEYHPLCYGDKKTKKYGYTLIDEYYDDDKLMVVLYYDKRNNAFKTDYLEIEEVKEL